MSRARWCPAYLALGSNLDHPAQHLRDAVRDLDVHASINVYRASRVVRSAPLDGSDQPDYFNAVVGVMTTLTPHSLLAVCQHIESRHGRDPDAPRWSARSLDIDIVAMGQVQVDEPALQIPHPGATQRAFVLRPLIDVAPSLALPGLGPIGKYVSQVDFSTLQPAPDLVWRSPGAVAL